MKQKNISLVITSLILFLLVLSGPAQAFNLLLTFNKHNPIKGEIVTFTASINIKDTELLPIGNLTLTLNGPEKQTCIFSPSGEKLGDCKGILSINRTSKSQNHTQGYGYGNYYGYGYSWNYGYGYGYTSDEPRELVYEIKLDTSNYIAGDYETELSIKIEDKSFSERSSQKLKIRELPQQNSESSSRSRSNSNPENNICETDWTCNSWSACSNGWQYRSCTLLDSDCLTYPNSPKLSQKCQIENLASKPGNSKEEQTNKITEEKAPHSSKITGAVIGPGNLTLADLFITILTMLFIIGGLTTTILLRKASLRRKMAYYSYTSYQ